MSGSHSFISAFSMNFNTLRPRRDGHHFADDSFTCIFFNENCCIFSKFSLKYVRKGPIDNNQALVQIMAWRRSGDKPFSEPMIVSLPTHICVTWPQWVNTLFNQYSITAHLSKWHQPVETHSLHRMNFKFMAALGWAIVSLLTGPLQNSIRS